MDSEACRPGNIAVKPLTICDEDRKFIEYGVTRIAASIADSIRAKGAICLSKKPISGEGGWAFRFIFDDQRVNFFLNVASLESLEDDAWCVALIPIAEGLFRRAKPVPNELITSVEASVKKLGATGLRWWNARDFEREL